VVGKRAESGRAAACRRPASLLIFSALRQSYALHCSRLLLLSLLRADGTPDVHTSNVQFQSQTVTKATENVGQQLIFI